MKYTKIVILALLASTTLVQFIATMGTDVKLTKSEVAKLKDYLTTTREDAKEKVAQVDAKLEKMREEKMDLQSDEVKAVKDEKYRWQDIVDGNNKLLGELRTGKYSYSLVVAQLKSLGTNPQEALQTTGLRTKQLKGEIVHPLLIEIDAINPSKPSEDIDDAYAIYKIGKAPDKRMQYVCTDLLNRLLTKHRGIMDKAALQDAVITLTAILDEFKDNTKIAKVLKNGKRWPSFGFWRLSALE